MQKVTRAVCLLAELSEGIGKAVSLGDNGETCAVFLIAGEVFATGSLCPHQNSSLDGAPVEDCTVVCRTHGYRFDLKTGNCLTVGGYGVPVYDASIRDGSVFVSYWEFDD